jgi:hypothetical protein
MGSGHGGPLVFRRISSPGIFSASEVLDGGRSLAYIQATQ